MTQKIRVLIVDDFADARESISKLLYFERDIEVADSVGDGREAIQKAAELRPDVILMDINMPGMDGIAATETICGATPECEVIMMSVQGEPDFLRRAMLAGAREYLVKPFTGDELAGSIRHVYELAADKRSRLAAAKPVAQAPAADPHPAALGHAVAVFCPKGGVGRTTVATNVAVALRNLTGKKVVLVDGNLAFGDVAVMLNLPTRTTISDLIPMIHGIDRDVLERILTPHSSGIKVLAGPPRPELAELVSPDHLRTILAHLKAHYDYVVIDTPATFEDSALAILDLSDQILLLATMEMPAIKNVKLFLEVAEALHYPAEKLTLVLNRTDSAGGIQSADIEQNLRFKVSGGITNAWQTVITAMNQGVPVLLSQPDSQVARNLLEVARLVLTPADAELCAERVPPATNGSREAKSGLGLGKLRWASLTPFASRKGSN